MSAYLNETAARPRGLTMTPQELRQVLQLQRRRETRAEDDLSARSAFYGRTAPAAHAVNDNFRRS